MVENNSSEGGDCEGEVLPAKPPGCVLRTAPGATSVIDPRLPDVYRLRDLPRPKQHNVSTPEDSKS